MKCKQLTEELEVSQRRQAEAAGSRQQQQQHGSHRWGPVCVMLCWMVQGVWLLSYLLWRSAAIR